MVGSGTPPGAISCSRRLPRDATRIVTRIGPSISGLCGSVVTAPLQVPARPFKTPKEAGASSFGEMESCPDEEPRARVGPHCASSPIHNTIARNLTRHLLLEALQRQL